MVNELYLFGASGHAKVILDNFYSKGISIKAILDDNPQSEYLMNIPVIHSNNFNFSKHQFFIISIGNNNTRKKIVNNLLVKYTTIVHQSAIVSQFASIKEGTVIMPNVVVNAAAKLGKHCIINSNAVVEHDCILQDFVHISPGAAVAGNVKIGEGTHVGIGASIIQGITIGKWVTIGAGAVIINDVPDYAVIVGNPGRIIKFNK